MKPLTYYFLFLLIAIRYKNVISKTKKKHGSLITCPPIQAPQNALIAHLVAVRKYKNGGKSSGYSVNRYLEHDKVYFHCKSGYSSTVHSALYMTCGSNGKWFPPLEQLGKCVLNKDFNKCTGMFQCKKSKQCISAQKHCDCVSDCDDGSDEEGCNVRRRLIWAPATGRDSSGVITSLGYPRTYPTNFSCVYHIYTLKGYKIEMDFEEFDLPEKEGNKCVDFVSLVGGMHSKFTGSDTKNFQNRIRSRRKLHKRKCGKNGFKKVYSDLSHITINVSIGHLIQPRRVYRGFSLIWKVRNAAYFHRIMQNSSTSIESMETEEGNTSSENVYTILTPIAISALIPLSLIAFLCCHRYLRRRYISKKNAGGSLQQETNFSEKQSMVLTENNLAKFDNEMSSRESCVEQTAVHNTIAVYTESDTFSKRNQVNSTVTCDCPCCTAYGVARKDLQVDKRNSDTYSSHQSEIPRYIMSYDVPSQQATLLENNSVINKQASFVTPDINYEPRLPSPVYTSSSHLNYSLPLKRLPSKCSRESARHSYGSKSTSSCKLCSHHKLVRQHRKTFECSQSDLFSQPTVDFNNEDMYRSSEDFSEFIDPVNSDCYARDSSIYNEMDSSTKLGSDMYDFNIHPVIEKSKESSLNLDDGNYGQKTRHLYFDTTYGKEKYVTGLSYSENNRTNDVYAGMPPFSNAERSRGSSLICTH